jgi:hypothetical protein
MGLTAIAMITTPNLETVHGLFVPVTRSPREISHGMVDGALTGAGLVPKGLCCGA